MIGSIISNKKDKNYLDNLSSKKNWAIAELAALKLTYDNRYLALSASRDESNLDLQSYYDGVSDTYLLLAKELEVTIKEINHSK